jgi:protein-tyrosine phosphatase
MIDLHCHILPGLDDGSPTLAESLAMARELVRAGFDTVTATPHVMDKDGMRPTREEIGRAVRELNTALTDAGIGLTALSGAEYHYDRPFPDLARKYFPLATLADSLYVLLELPMLTWPEYLEYSIMPQPSDPPELRRTIAFIRPVIAHPERNEDVLRDYRRLRAPRELGYLYQVNLESILGRAGKHVAKVVKKMAQEKMIDFIGTDGHNAAMLRDLLPDWRKGVEKNLGPSQLPLILNLNPQRVLRNETIDLED